MADAERILSQNEVDALLSAIDSGAQVGGGDDAALPYDFRHPARLSREGIRGLQVLHEGFARSLQSALSGLLRAPAEAKVAGVHPLSIKEALHSLSQPTVLTVLSCEPLEGFLVLDMTPSIAGPAVERLLGSGKAGPPGDPRPLTAVEWGVYETLLGAVLDLLRDAWAPLADLKLRVLRRESDPTALPLPRIEEMGVMVVVELVVGEQRGTLDLIFPVRTVEPCLERLQAAPAPAVGAAPPEADGGLPGRISPAEVSVTAHLPAEAVRVGEIRDLRPGDLIVSGRSAAAPVLLSVEGCPKFQARLGRMKDRRAAKIERGAAAEEGPRARASVRPGAGPRGAEAPAVEALLSVPLPASVVIAEKRATLSEVLALRPGDLIAFERRAEAPLELRVGGRRIAEGSAVRVGERFGLKVGAVADPKDRVRALGT